ncbi:hypothetical protein [Myxosarcina sp. GI1(2024)]
MPRAIWIYPPYGIVTWGGVEYWKSQKRSRLENPPSILELAMALAPDRQYSIPGYACVMHY